MIPDATLGEIIAAGERATPRPWTDATNKIGANGRGIAEVDFDYNTDRRFVISAANYAVALATELRQARELLVRSRKLIRDSQKVAEHYNDVPSVQEHRALIEAIDAATGKDGAK